MSRQGGKGIPVGLVLGYCDIIILGSSDGDFDSNNDGNLDGSTLVVSLGSTYGLVLGIDADEGTELGSPEGSFDSSNE